MQKERVTVAKHLLLLQVPNPLLGCIELLLQVCNLFSVHSAARSWVTGSSTCSLSMFSV